MMNTLNFLPRANLDSIILDENPNKTDYNDEDEFDSYEDEYTLAYNKLKEMYAYNYDTIIDTDYDEMHKVQAMKKDPRAYKLLEHLNTNQSVFYQTKIRNKA